MLARTLRGEGEGLVSPAADGGRPVHSNVYIPRLDVVYLNAGIGGWDGVPYLEAVWGCIKNMPEAVTYWKWFNFPEKGVLVKPQSEYLSAEEKEKQVSVTEKDKDDAEPPLGQIFCSNVFGHYLLTHELMPLLSVKRGRVDGDRGRVVFISTLEPHADDLPMDDLQGLKSKNPYYGSKRLTDLLGLSAKLPAVRSINSDFYQLKNYKLPPYPYAEKKEENGTATTNGDTNANDATDPEDEQEIRPEFYVTQPGIVNTNISGMNPLMSFLMLMGFYLCRLLGSVWFPISAYPAAVAPVWVGLSPQALLDSMETPPPPPPAGSNQGSARNSTSSNSSLSSYGSWDAGDPVQAKVKWGSACDRFGNVRVLKTEVPGWGWSGRVGEVVREGRRSDAVDLEREAREDFESDGRYCWTYMEGLRKRWEGRLGVGDAAR